jgi:glycosyltransferase involved in cell wall biosynthesis
MNILFVNNFEVSPISGGVQRVTSVLSQEFTAKLGYKCFLAYFTGNKVELKTEFIEKIQINRNKIFEELSDFVIKNKIDFVICQETLGNSKLFKNIRKAVDKAKNSKLVYCFHNTPDFYFVRPNNCSELYKILYNKQLMAVKKLAVGLLPKFLYNFIVAKQTEKHFDNVNNCFDYIFLLSEHFIESWCKLSNISQQNKKKIVVMPNSLSFKEFVSSSDISKKENVILIVTRLSERQKRISKSLKIWKKIQQEIDIKDWKLVILGVGDDEKYYKMLVNKHKIKEVYFEGRQNPVEYYKRSSIFIMTSAYEGFPMTLLEAQQMGVVPIAFDSFGALHNVIINDFSGIIVEKNDQKKYVNQLIALMQNKEERQTIAKNAIESCKQFSIEIVVEKWKNFFENNLNS